MALDYANGRQPTFARYIILKERINYTKLVHYEDQPEENEFWVDPTSPEKEGAHLGLWFHAFVGEYDDNPILA
jgi:hypothetical protein